MITPGIFTLEITHLHQAFHKAVRYALTENPAIVHSEQHLPEYSQLATQGPQPRLLEPDPTHDVEREEAEK